MSYKKSEIIEMVNQALLAPATLYTCDFINYKGEADGVRYTEIAACELLKKENLNKFDNILKITRQSSYKTESHVDLAKREMPEKSNRCEEWLAIKLYGKTLKHIGTVLDFQVPLKNKASDAAGKIDLISYNKINNTAYMLELKKPKSEETLLRCVMEVYTYWKTVDKDKLLRDFCIECTELRKAILVFNSCFSYKDFSGDDCDAVYDLMTNKLGVDLFVLGDDCKNIIDGKYVRQPTGGLNN